MSDQTPAPEPVQTPSPEPVIEAVSEDASVSVEPESVPKIEAETVETQVVEQSSLPGAEPAEEMPQPPPDSTQGKEGEMPQIPVSEAFPPETAPEPKLAESTPPPAASAAVVATVPNLARELWAKALSAIQSRSRKKLDKILTLLEAEKSIANEDVQKLLRVSRQTATRYLDQLEKEGKIIQAGRKGRGVRYVKAH